MRSVYTKGAHSCLLVYDVTNPRSFERMKEWHADLMAQNGQTFPLTPIMVLANKVDAPEEKRVVQYNEADSWCEEQNVCAPLTPSLSPAHSLAHSLFSKLTHAEVSARDGTGVEAAFTEAAKKALIYYGTLLPSPTNPL